MMIKTQYRAIQHEPYDSHCVSSSGKEKSLRLETTILESAGTNNTYYFFSRRILVENVPDYYSW